jgi:hypothetical protein
MYQAGFVSLAPQDKLDQAFEHCGSIAEANEHNGEIPQS